METSALTGSIESCMQHIALKRGGLTLRVRLEKRIKIPCPLVMMLHGFGGNMWVAPGSRFDRLAG